MKSKGNGTNNSVEVLKIMPHGLWLSAQGEKHFLSFEFFPWFKMAPVGAVFHVEKQGRDSFCWPDLDVDLSMSNIKHPEKYPLCGKLILEN